MYVSPKTIGKIVAYVLAFLLLVHWFVGGQQEIVDRTYEPDPITAPLMSPSAYTLEENNVAEPTTVAGYKAMFDAIPINQWGAADIGISVKLGDGRRVWLFGDTLRNNDPGFVHSTALTQSNGVIHVSRGGQQLLPNAGKVFYWPEVVKAQGANKIKVTAAPIKMKGTGLFDFKRNDHNSRTAILHVENDGDVIFDRWVELVPRPTIKGDGEDIVILGPNHYGYWFVTHDIVLANGKRLRSMSQNWDDGFENHLKPNGQLRYSDWGLVFDSVK